MSNEAQDLRAQLDGVLGNPEEMDELGELAQALTQVAAISSEAEKKKKALKARIMEILDAQGLEAAVAGGRRLGFSTRKFFSVAQGDTPEVGAENMRRFKEWMEATAPTENVPASQKIQRAVNAWMDQNPGEQLPDFIHEGESRSLTNRQA